LEHADEVLSEAMRALFLNKHELSTVNKKILYGILSKKPEKNLMKLAIMRASQADGGRTGIAGNNGPNGTKTPLFYDLSQSSLKAPDYVLEETGQLSIREHKSSRKIKDFLKNKSQQWIEDEKMKEVMLLDDEESQENQDA
jgi:hypothetical protein